MPKQLVTSLVVLISYLSSGVDIKRTVNCTNLGTNYPDSPGNDLKPSIFPTRKPRRQALIVKAFLSFNLSPPPSPPDHVLNCSLVHHQIWWGWSAEVGGGVTCLNSGCNWSHNYLHFVPRLCHTITNIFARQVGLSYLNDRKIILSHAWKESSVPEGNSKQGNSTVSDVRLGHWFYAWCPNWEWELY